MSIQSTLESDSLSMTMAWSKIVEETIHNLSLSLIENPNVSHKYLSMTSRIFRPKDYLAITQERSLTYCGFPLCKNKMKQNRSLIYDQKSGKMINIEDSQIHLFCSMECYKSSTKWALDLEDSPPYTRHIRDLVKMVFPESDKVFESIENVSDQGPTRIMVTERVSLNKFDPPSKKPDSIEGYQPKVKPIQPVVKPVGNEEDLEGEDSDPYEEDPEMDQKYQFKMSTYQIVWTQLSHWTTPDSIEYLKSGKLPIVYDTSFQMFNETILKRCEVVDDKLSLVIPHLCKMCRFSNMDKIFTRIKEAITIFNYERSLSSLDTNQWNLIGMILIKCCCFTDPVLEKEWSKVSNDLILGFGVNQEQFGLLVQSISEK
jgi:hypothetical protein